MKARLKFMGIQLDRLARLSLPLLLFWFILLIKMPYSFIRYFHIHSLGLFLVLVFFYYLSLSLPKQLDELFTLSLTMVIFALALSYMWTSGFSDNLIIGGLVPYKDSKNYYIGANLLLHGIPMLNAGQATERPLFPGFLASLLLLTGQNLKIALGLTVQLAAGGLYVSARQIRNSFGAPAASLFAALLYIYIRPWLGYSLSEPLGFIAGCWGFAIMWRAALNLRKTDLILGVAALLLGTSARAGAFLIFPMLILWVGWVFRGEKQFSWKAAASAFVLVVGMYVLMNSLYPKILGIPSDRSFANFSYAIYGQVKGGTGWHSAIEDLGTRSPTVVYRAALDFFLQHPISLFIGFAKSYRDLLLFGDRSIFPVSGQGWQYIPNVILWLGMLMLLVLGVIQLFRRIDSNLASLLIAGFIGFFLSIPFLPPIDGGSRFYASTLPFFFAPLAAGAQRFSKDHQEQLSDNYLLGELLISRSVSATLLVLALIAPILIYLLSGKPTYSTLSCPAGQQPFVIEPHPASYIDLIKSESMRCGIAPEVCLTDFEQNNIELATDDFYQSLLSKAKDGSTNIRLLAALDLIKDNSHYFYFPLEKILGHDSSKLITGCAVEIKTKNQSIFQVESVLLYEN